MSLKGVTSEEDGQGVKLLAVNKEGGKNLCSTFFLSAKKRQCKHHMTGKENVNVKPERAVFLGMKSWSFNPFDTKFSLMSVLSNTLLFSTPRKHQKTIGFLLFSEGYRKAKYWKALK